MDLLLIILILLLLFGRTREIVIFCPVGLQANREPNL
jgi:hypothetical protein